MIPKKYQWLKDEYHPKIMREMLKLYGIREIVGEDHNPVILEWAHEIRKYVGINYNADEIPWCGLVMGVCAYRAGFVPPKICIRAKEWTKFGWEKEDAELGDILIFNRSGGGHVGLYIGEDKNYYHILGGNQGNEVNIRRMDKRRLISVRECPWKWQKPNNIRKVILTNSGEISDNEI